MVVRIITLMFILVACSGCSIIVDGFKAQAHEIVIYKNEILSQLIELINVFPERTNEFYTYEDWINEDCKELNSGATFKLSTGGKYDVPDELGSRIVGTMDECHDTVKKVDRMIAN